MRFTPQKQAPNTTHTAPLRPVRTLLLWLVFASLLPGVIGAVVLFFQLYDEGHAQLQKNTIQTARALAQAVDGQLIRAQVIAQSLATSPYLEKADFAAFHHKADDLLKSTGRGINIVLIDDKGTMLLNTARPFGEALPRTGNPEQVREIFATGRPMVSNVFASGLTGQPRIAVQVPVVLDGRVAYVLSIGLLTEQFNQILQSQHLPPNWVATVYDRTGTAAARTHTPEKYVGQKGVPEVVQRLLEVSEGSLAAQTREGTQSLIMFSRSPVSSMNVAIAIPRESLEAPLMRTISLFGLGIALLFASGTGLAWWVGDRVARSVQVLKNSAVALAGGEAQMVPRVHFREANEVADAMAHTAQLLTQRTDALQASHTALQESEERYRALVEWSPEAIVVHRDGKLLYVNAAAIRMFGAIAEVDVVGKSIVDWVHPDSQRLMLERVRKYVEHGDALPMIGMRLVRVDGTVIDVEVQGTGIVYKGKPAIQSSMRDITVRKQAQEVRRWAALLFANIQDGAVVTDQNGTILAVNPAFTYITGYSEADILGQNMRRLQSGRQDRAFYQQMWHTILTTGGWQGEIWNRRMNGEIYLERLTIHAALDEQGTVVNYVSTSTDLTHVKRADQMAHLAHHDALTGLPNRLQLLSRLEHALETAKRHCNMGGVLFFDLDRFKAVNDTWGHPAGDDLLQQVARRLSTRMRDMDTLARFGGDEFVAVLEGLDGPQSVATLAGELVQLLGLPFTLAGGQEVHIGGSIGIAMFPTDGDCVETLLRHADTALYRAKAEGRNTYRFHVG